MAVPGSGRRFNVSVISPERTLYEGEAQFAVVPAFDGEIGILADHAPLMAVLGDGILRLETEEGTRRFRLSGGFVQVVENRVSVLSEKAEEAQEA
ncbi:MAG: ATP synthase F1 subunit epsilon [Gemmatimonadota bacterium]